ncbi:hypothetical protein [Methylobacterium fujisawaense]
MSEIAEAAAQGGEDAIDEAFAVAKAGYEAMMASREKVVAGSIATQFEAAVLNRILPDSMKAERHRKMSEPGSAE